MKIETVVEVAPAIKPGTICPACGSTCVMRTNGGSRCNSCTKVFNVRPDMPNRMPAKSVLAQGKDGTFVNGQPADFSRNSLRSR